MNCKKCGNLLYRGFGLCPDCKQEEHDRKVKAKVIDEILECCGGEIHETDCDLCTFAIFEDDIRVGCEILRLKEQGK